jgi:predicted enzyme involved in methoxymalonyl-ACP biosynthesis
VIFEPLAEYLEAHLACEDIVAASYIAPFDQQVQEILDPTSALHRFDPHFLLLHSELDALLRGPNDPRDAVDPYRVQAAVLSSMQSAVNHALEKTRATVLLTNFAAPDCCDLGLADWRRELGQQEFAWQLNSALNKAFRFEPRVQIVDLCRLMALHGHERARDRRLYYLAKMPWHETFLPRLANELARHIGVSLGRVRKCLVVDLDNTLWHGVLGEDGPWGVRVGTDDGIAEAHLDLQRRIVAIK